MKNYALVILCISLMILGPSACGLFQSCPEALQYFKIEALELTNFRFNDDPYGDPSVPDSKMPWNEFGLNTAFKSSYHSANTNTAGGAYLYALSCVQDGYMGSEVGVDTLYLVTLDDYSAEYVTNDTLNNILTINDWGKGTTFYSLEEYLSTNAEGILFNNFTVKLTEAPSEGRTIEFELIYVLSSGETFKQTSAPVNLR